jgi:U3 small nucleolar RNA-associated protein 16
MDPLEHHSAHRSYTDQAKFPTFPFTASDQLNPATTYLMLSKLLTTARALLDRASQAEEPEPQQTAVASTLADAMVTTRRQSGKNVIDRSNDDDSVRIEASGSSRKRQNLSSHSEVSNLIDEEDVGTPAVKRQKILPVRAKDDDKMPNKNSRVVVEIPISPFGLEHGGQLSGNRKQPVKRIGTAEDVEEVAASDAHLSRLEIPDSDSDDKDSEVAEVAEESDLDISSPGQKKPTNDQISIASAAATGAVPGFPNPKHKRFDSEESEVLPFSTALEKAESEDESSDDDAPEVVGALEALEQARMKVREAAKAVEE